MKLLNDAVVACVGHNKRRTYHKPVRPDTKCVAYWLVYLADQLQTDIYKGDVDALLAFAGKQCPIIYEELNAEL